LQRAGWHRLDIARASMRLGPAGLATDLVGLADPHMGWDRLPPPPARPAGQAAPDLVLGVVHAPYRSAVQALVDDAARLVLAGHTHGGQVALPGFGALVSNTDLPLRYASGLHRWPTGGWAEGAYLHVSAGLGTSPYAPFRLAARPEATWLKLTPAT
jgi:predicted MPP superfamily phosphohydrolase